MNPPVTPYPYQWGPILHNNLTICAEDAREGCRRNAPDARPLRPGHPLTRAALLWQLLAEHGPKSPEQLARIHHLTCRPR